MTFSGIWKLILFWWISPWTEYRLHNVYGVSKPWFYLTSFFVLFFKKRHFGNTFQNSDWQMMCFHPLDFISCYDLWKEIWLCKRPLHLQLWCSRIWRAFTVFGPLLTAFNLWNVDCWIFYWYLFYAMNAILWKELNPWAQNTTVLQQGHCSNGVNGSVYSLPYTLTSTPNSEAYNKTNYTVFCISFVA